MKNWWNYSAGKSRARERQIKVKQFELRSESCYRSLSMIAEKQRLCAFEAEK